MSAGGRTVNEADVLAVDAGGRMMAVTEER
jgi:hypothetical protein